MLPQHVKTKLIEFMNVMFIVRAAVSLKNVEESRIRGRTVNGKFEQPDFSRVEVFGMTLGNMAIHGAGGHTITLYRKSDMKILFKRLTEFIEFTDELKKSINIQIPPELEEIVSLLTNLSTSIFELNRSTLTEVEFNFNTLSNSVGFVSENDLVKKMLDRQSKRKAGQDAPLIRSMKW